MFSDDVEPESAGGKSNASACFSGCCSGFSSLGTVGDEQLDFSEFSDDDVESDDVESDDVESDNVESDDVESDDVEPDDVEPDSATGKSSASGCIASDWCSGVFSLGTVGDEELDSSVSLLSRAAFNCIPMVVAILKS